MINPDYMPLWFAIPAAVVAWTAFLAPHLRAARRARRHR